MTYLDAIHFAVVADTYLHVQWKSEANKIIINSHRVVLVVVGWW